MAQGQVGSCGCSKIRGNRGVQLVFKYPFLPVVLQWEALALVYLQQVSKGWEQLVRVASAGVSATCREQNGLPLFPRQLSVPAALFVQLCSHHFTVDPEAESLLGSPQKARPDSSFPNIFSL